MGLHKSLLQILSEKKLELYFYWQGGQCFNITENYVNYLFNPF